MQLSLCPCQASLTRIEKALAQILAKGALVAQSLDQLQQEVARNTSVEQSAVVLIQGLAAQIQAAGTDPAKLQAIVQQLQANDDALAGAIAQNTPAAFGQASSPPG